MLIKEIIIKNFRGYKNEHRIPIEQLTAFIGKNDSGKSTILDALAVFFDHPLGRIEGSDFCVHSEDTEIRIGCVFSDLPDLITLDATSVTNLAQEYLLNDAGCLEIHKVYEVTDGKVKKPKVVAISNHPSASGFNNLLSFKITELRSKWQEVGINENVDSRSSAALRHAIWGSAPDLKLCIQEVELNKEAAKAIWEKLSSYMPEYALFRADRPSTDEDAEVQDPLKVAIKQAIQEVQAELNAVKEKVQERVMDVADRTIEKLADFDQLLSSQFKPCFKSDPKWDGLFKLSLTGDDDIPINKRGSGVRRLILFSFFRAEAERLQRENNKTNIIYAIEEPETAQHPDNQRKVVEALQTISNTEGCQVLLTTHVPALASLLPTDSIRYIHPDDERGRCVSSADEDTIKTVTSELGIVPDNRAKVIVCVEGPHDLSFLQRINRILCEEGSLEINIFSDPRVAFVVLGGSTLKEWVNRRYLKNIGLPEVHIYDRDELKDGKYKYQDARDAVNSRDDNSIAFLTQKREMENYLHIDAIKDAFKNAVSCDLELDIEDGTDVEKSLKAIIGQSKVQRRSLKHWLNENAANNMTVERLKGREGYDEICNWFTEIINRVS